MSSTQSSVSSPTSSSVGSLLSASRMPKNAKAAHEQLLKVFNKIVDFVSDLNTAFGAKFHEVAMYNHLLSKTKISQKSTMQRHVDLFREFGERNKDALLSKDVAKIVSRRVSYSEKVYLDIHRLLTQSDIDTATTDSIWVHLLVINASIDPTSEAREILRQLQSSGSSEGQFLDQFFGRIQQSIDSSGGQISDPMAAASSILQSGLLNDLVGQIDSKVKDGSLDFGKLLGTVQGMLGSFGGMNMAPTSNSSGGNSPGMPSAGPDLGGMLGMMMNGGLGSMMSAIMSHPGPGSSGVNTLAGTPEVARTQAAIEAQIETAAKQEAEQESKTLALLSSSMASINLGKTEINDEKP